MVRRSLALVVQRGRRVGVRGHVCACARTRERALGRRQHRAFLRSVLAPAPVLAHVRLQKDVRKRKQSPEQGRRPAFSGALRGEAPAVCAGGVRGNAAAPPPPGPLCPGRGVRAPVASHVTLRTRRRPRRQRVAPGGFALCPPQSSGLRRRMWTGLAAVAVAELPASFPPPVSKRRGSGRENRRRSFSPTCWPRGPGARVPGPRAALASAQSRCCCYTQYVTEAVISLASLRPFVRNRTKQRLRMTLWL